MSRKKKQPHKTGKVHEAGCSRGLIYHISHKGGKRFTAYVRNYGDDWTDVEVFAGEPPRKPGENGLVRIRTSFCRFHEVTDKWREKHLHND